jgi:hypothetical protein
MSDEDIRRYAVALKRNNQDVVEFLKTSIDIYGADNLLKAAIALYSEADVLELLIKNCKHYIDHQTMPEDGELFIDKKEVTIYHRITQVKTTLIYMRSA